MVSGAPAFQATAARVFMGRDADHWSSPLRPLQLGVGSSDGALVMVRGVQALLEAHPDFWLLRVDVTNAFNEVEWAAVFEAVRGAGLGHFYCFFICTYQRDRKSRGGVAAAA